MKLNFNEFNGNYEIIHNGFSWVSDGRKPQITIRGKNKKGKYISKVCSLQSARKKETETSESKTVTVYSDFVAFGKILPFRLICTAEIINENIVEPMQ